MVFHAAEVIQERNDHNLMLDFEQEVPGYLNNESIIQTLSDLALENGSNAISSNLIRCYEAMVAKGFIPGEELPLVKAWVADLETSQI
jgi:hypothetical protein